MQNFYMDLTIANGLKGNSRNSTYFDLKLYSNYKEIWRNLRNLNTYQSPTVDLVNNAIYISGVNLADNNKKVLASVDRGTGFLNWLKDDAATSGISPCIDEKGFIYSANFESVLKVDKDSNTIWEIKLDSKPVGFHFGADGNLFASSVQGVVYKISQDGNILNQINLVDTLKLKTSKESENNIISGLNTLLGTEGWGSKSFCLDENYLYIQGQGEKAREGIIIKLSTKDLSVIGTLVIKKAQRSLMAPCLSADGEYLVVLSGGLFSGKYNIIKTNFMTVEATIDASYNLATATPPLDIDNNLFFYYKKGNVLCRYNIINGKLNWNYFLNDSKGNPIYNDVFGLTAFRNYYLFGGRKKDSSVEIVLLDKTNGKVISTTEISGKGTFNNASVCKTSDYLYLSMENQTVLSSKNISGDAGGGLICLQKI